MKSCEGENFGPKTNFSFQISGSFAVKVFKLKLMSKGEKKSSRIFVGITVDFYFVCRNDFSLSSERIWNSRSETKNFFLLELVKYCHNDYCVHFEMVTLDSSKIYSFVCSCLLSACFRIKCWGILWSPRMDGGMRVGNDFLGMELKIQEKYFLLKIYLNSKYFLGE